MQLHYAGLSRVYADWRLEHYRPVIEGNRTFAAHGSGYGHAPMVYGKGEFFTESTVRPMSMTLTGLVNGFAGFFIQARHSGMPAASP